MINREKYKDEIINYIEDRGEFCKEFIEPNIIKPLGLECDDISCIRCQLLQTIWLDEEYKEPEPEVDWSKVEVDTPLKVTKCDGTEVIRYFAKCIDGKVYCWDIGTTSLTNNRVIEWGKARLLTAEEIDEMRHKNDVTYIPKIDCTESEVKRNEKSRF